MIFDKTTRSIETYDAWKKMADRFDAEWKDALDTYLAHQASRFRPVGYDGYHQINEYFYSHRKRITAERWPQYKEDIA